MLRAHGVAWADASEPCEQHSPSFLCAGGDDSVSKEAQLIDPIVSGFIQLGCVQPIGRPIKVSTQRGFNFFDLVLKIMVSVGGSDPREIGSWRLPPVLWLSRS